MLYTVFLTLSWRRPISYRNQPTDLLRKSMDWFLYDIGHPFVSWFVSHDSWQHKVIQPQMIRNWFLLNLKIIFNVHIEYNRYSKIQKIGPNLVKFASSFPMHLLQEKLRITNDCHLISSCFSAICDSSNSYACFLIKKRM